MAKFTFKKERPENGLAAVGRPRPDTQIKRSGRVVGLIKAPTWQTHDNRWGVSLAVQRSDGSFTWITLKKRGESEKELRQWVKENEEVIQSKFDLHELDLPA